MPSFQIVIDKELDFDPFVKAFGDLRPDWDAVAKEFYAIEEEQFSSEGHGKWPPLSPRYAAWKAAHYGGKPLLIRDGNLLAAVSGKGVKVDKQPKQLNVTFTGVPYWRYHQEGTSKMPQRKVIDLTKENRTRLGNVVRDSLLVRIKRLSN